MTAPPIYPHQIIARDFLLKHPRAGLFLDPGYGKTRTVLEALQPHHFPVLVVAPKRVAREVWPQESEIARPDLSITLVAGSPAQRAKALAQPSDITVISRENLKDKLPRYRTVVVDELSGFKDRSSVRWKTLKPHALAAEHFWGLTGTPTPNGLINLWSQVYLMDRGERLGKTLTAYRERYFAPGRRLPNGVIVEWVIRDGATEKIHALVEDICLSMEGEIELPPVTYNVVKIPMPETLKPLYKRMKDDLVLDLEMLGAETVSAGNAAVLSGKLSQMAAGFIYSDSGDKTYTRLHSAKVDALSEIVEETGSPVLVFYRYTAEREAIQAALPQSVGIDSPNVISDWNAGKVPMLLAHPASAAHGLNLQHGGCTTVWTTLDWDLELWLQANRRLLRPGQKHPVMIHSLQMEGTVDYACASRLAGKETTQAALLHHLVSPL